LIETRSLIGFFVLVVVSVASVQAAGQGDWQYNFSPYIWGTRLEGDVATLPPAHPAEVDVSFSDILENLDLAVMGTGQARKGRFGVWGDVFYSKLSADGNTRDQLFSDADYDQTLSFLTLGASWRLLERPSASVDALVGARYSYLDNKFKLEAGLLPARDRYESEDWVDPVIGLAARVTFAANWYASGWAMNAVAGDSYTNYDLFGGIGYAFNRSYSFIVGYRHIKIDYEKDAFLYDVKLYGPMAGFTFRW
jgi:hypothetical protein